ncbi:helix-turn-helix transcriptional regulator [Sphingobium phenoxybenzoativorans]|uniref:Helix-turn-helix transcriptional regulator n=1 Tax=Sphingobium phenoxybenzoativorans TaxID=1592790 RepID=A0A975K7H2_9SPHN|nr:helix-turn-helix transcriptional regulator [Sphingobium phenoxybenzoativorans]QUT04882.1 helix-turn-helix transcriptional regulator [Sphingobium phenoxybenzoativorans]
MDDIEQLTERQRDCLRLVVSGHNSKGIARLLGISPLTVDQHLKAAIKTLRVSSRGEAARMLAAYENAHPQTSGSQAAPIAQPLLSPIMDPSAGGEGGQEMRRSPVPFLPPIGGDRHDLTINQKIFAILRVAVISAGSVGALVAAGYWINYMVS